MGDTTTVTLTASVSGLAVDSLPVTLTAEFLRRTGGHHHLDDRLLFSHAPLVPQGAAADRSVTGYHARDSIWYATPVFGGLLESLAQNMTRDSAGTTYYLQVNDASLPFGGTFSVFPDTTGTGQLMDRPYDRGHRRSHASGVDVDISWCQVRFTGDDGQQDRVSGTSCGAQGGVGVSPQDLREAATSLGLVVLTEGNPPHYHLRLPE